MTHSFPTRRSSDRCHATVLAKSRGPASRPPMAEDKQPHRSRFHKAKDDAQFAKQATTTPQTAHPAYKLAFQDTDFLLREDLRPVRFQLELLKPELLLDEAGIESTLVIYGSARIPEPSQADALETAATDDATRNIARRLDGQSTRLNSRHSCASRMPHSA